MTTVTSFPAPELILRRLMFAVGVLSAAVIAYQVAIIQLLSRAHWQHFAGMVISLALLGFGAAGTLLTLFRSWVLRHAAVMVPATTILSGVLMALAPDLSSTFPFDSYLLFTSAKQKIAFAANCLFYFFPFFFAAVAIGIVFAQNVQAIGRLYFADLCGAGVGAIAIALLAWFVYPDRLPAFIAGFTLVSGAMLITREKKAFLFLLAIAGAVFVASRFANPSPLAVSQYKSLSRTLTLPGASVIIQRPGPFGLVEVVEAEGLRFAPGLSLTFHGEIPVRKMLFNNGDWVGPVVSWTRGDSIHLLDFATSGLPYVIGARKNVLLLNSSTGMNVSHAIRHGAVSVDAVEAHPGVAALLRRELVRDNDSLFYHPAVHLHVIEPRTFLFSAKSDYDLVELPVVGVFGGTSGLHAMREEYMFTKEALHDAWHVLESDGVISITAWMDYPFRAPLKMLATLVEVMEERGIEPRKHLLAVRSWGTVTFLAKKTTVTDSESARVREFCDRLQFDPLFLPDIVSGERQLNNILHDTTFFEHADEIVSGGREQFYDDYDFNVRPATDNKPYFSQFLKLRAVSKLSDTFGSGSLPFLEMGLLITAAAFFLTAALAVTLIIVPLFGRGWGNVSKLPVALYFTGLGLGYMMTEVAFIQKFILVFGNPVYAVAFVLGVMLFFSGIGSYFSSRISKGLGQARILAVVTLVLVAYAVAIPEFVRLVSFIQAWPRILLCLLITGLPAFFMGMPFPSGLARCGDRDLKVIPWAWGINGCTSVMAASLAPLVAVGPGSMFMIAFAAVCYGMCFVLVRLGKV